MPGFSIEDNTYDEAKPLYDLDDAVARMRAARAAIDKAGGDVLLTGRAEGFLVGRPDLDEAIARLKAYAEAGADCLYAPGIRTREQIAAVVKAVAPKPVNFLNSGAFGFTVDDLAALGVRRISVGSTLARVAYGAFLRAARQIADRGALRRVHRRGAVRGDQWFLPRRCRAAESCMSIASEPEPVTGQPVGPLVDVTPARLPGPVVLEGRFGRIEKLDDVVHAGRCGMR